MPDESVQWHRGADNRHSVSLLQLGGLDVAWASGYTDDQLQGGGVKFTLEVDVKGAAFLENPAGIGPEIARILRAASRRIEEGHSGAGVLRDFSGDRVGQYRCVDDE